MSRVGSFCRIRGRNHLTPLSYFLVVARSPWLVAVSLPSLPWPWQGLLIRTTVIRFGAHPNPIWGVPGGTSVEKPICQCRRHERPGFDPWVGKIPWRRAWQPTPVLLPGKSHGQRSLAGYSPQGCKELDMTEMTEHTQSNMTLMN